MARPSGRRPKKAVEIPAMNGVIAASRQQTPTEMMRRTSPEAIDLPCSTALSVTAARPGVNESPLSDDSGRGVVRCLDEVARPVRRAPCNSRSRGGRRRQPSHERLSPAADRRRRSQDGTLARRFFASDRGAGLWACLLSLRSPRFGRHDDDEPTEGTLLRDRPRREIRLRVVSTPARRSLPSRIDRHEDLVAHRARRRFRDPPQGLRLAVATRWPCRGQGPVRAPTCPAS